MYICILKKKCTHHASDHLLHQEDDDDDTNAESEKTGKSRGAQGRKMGGIPAVNIEILEERVSMECRKTKTKVITLANQKGQRQSSKPIKTRSNYT